jgi:preprotein translocase subunit SecE
VARDRQRAKQRKARRAQNRGPARSQPTRTDVPGELEHASGEVDEFEAALVSGADGQTVDDEPDLDANRATRDEEDVEDDSALAAPDDDDSAVAARRDDEELDDESALAARSADDDRSALLGSDDDFDEDRSADDERSAVAARREDEEDDFDDDRSAVAARRAEEEDEEDDFDDATLEKEAVGSAPAVRRETAPGAPTRKGGGRFLGFLRASWAELQRVQWPDRRQVAQATGVVIGFVIVAGLYLGVADWVAKQIVNAII